MLFKTYFQFALDCADYVAGPGRSAKDWEEVSWKSMCSQIFKIPRIF